MATHSSILAWKTPWTEVSGRPQSMGSQRVQSIQNISCHKGPSSCFLQWYLLSTHPTASLIPGNYWSVLHVYNLCISRTLHIVPAGSTLRRGWRPSTRGPSRSSGLRWAGERGPRTAPPAGGRTGDSWARTLEGRWTGGALTQLGLRLARPQSSHHRYPWKPQQTSPSPSPLPPIAVAAQSLDLADQPPGFLAQGFRA